MANYINEEILSEAYSHLNVEIFDDKVALNQLKSELTSFFEERAKFLFGEQIKIVIEFEKGCLRTKIKVVGNAAAVIYCAMTGYGDFRQSIDYLAKDSTILAQSANLEMVFRTKATYCDRVSVEKRRGVFGRVNELLAELDLIGRNIADSKLPSTSRTLEDFEINVKRFAKWQNSAEKLFKKLDSAETKACVSAGLLEEISQLPSEAPWSKGLKQKNFRAEMIKANPVLAGQIESSAAQYESTAKYVREYYENIVKQYAPHAT